MAITQTAWVVTVTTAGTAVQGPDTGSGTFSIVASEANTGNYVYVGNDGADDISATTGYPLKKDLNPIIQTVSNMNQQWFDAGTNGDKVVLFKLQSAQEGSSPAAT